MNFVNPQNHLKDIIKQIDQYQSESFTDCAVHASSYNFIEIFLSEKLSELRKWHLKITILITIVIIGNVFTC